MTPWMKRAGASCALVLMTTTLAAAGDLNPPGGVIAPTLKTLDEVEPRIPISLVTTPGDADSTFKIVKPGSYYLTGEIVGQPGKFGIEVATSNVTIDLMGFSMRATPGNGLSAIYTGFGAGLHNVSVVNGHIDGWIDGVDLTGVDGGRVAGVHSIDAQNNGLSLGTAIVVRDCTALGAAGYDFSDQGGCGYQSCVARNAGFSGFSTANQSSFEACVSEGNGFNGFSGSQGCSWSGCVARNNQMIGISATFACTIVHCTAASNGSHGIAFSSQCNVRDNDCAANGTAVADGAGLQTNGADSRIDGNNCVGNDIGINVTSSANLVVRNSASGNTTANYAVNITNTTSNLSTAGPWDNLIY